MTTNQPTLQAQTQHKSGRSQEKFLLSTVETLRDGLNTFSPNHPVKIRLCMYCDKPLLQRQEEPNSFFAKRRCCNGHCGQLMRQERERKARLSKRALNQRKREARAMARAEKEPNP